jgi:hypothetical protein
MPVSVYDDDTSWSIGGYAAFKYTHRTFVRLLNFDTSFIQALIAENNLKTGGLTININGSTLTKPVLKDQYMYIKNHRTLSEGYYKALTDMSIDHTIVDSDVHYVNADDVGIINDIQTLNAKIFAASVTSITANTYSDITFTYTLPAGSTFIDSIPYMAGTSASSDYGSITCNRYSASETQTIVRVFAGNITEPRAPGVRLVVLYTT